ncbi:hypothetical protein HRbin18_00926 [bacterium HR18]|nr:hypothetical protein HRbin18_00926 [bacterium HR18]
MAPPTLLCVDNPIAQRQRTKLAFSPNRQPIGQCGIETSTWGAAVIITLPQPATREQRPKLQCIWLRKEFGHTDAAETTRQ